MDPFFIFAAVVLGGVVVGVRRWNRGGVSGRAAASRVAASSAAAIGGESAGSDGSFYGDYLNRADGSFHDYGLQYGGGDDCGAHDGGGPDCDGSDGGGDCGGDGGGE